MTYDVAKQTINVQDHNLRQVNNFRFIHKGYEYRVTYKGGFAAYVAIDRREVGRRNFKYFSGIGGYKYWTAGQVINAVHEEVIKKVG